MQQNRDEEENSDSLPAESPGSGLLGRMRQGFDAARGRAVSAADTVTGVQFRRQFEDFTEAVTTAVVGVHRDNEELKDQTDQLNTVVASTQREQEELRGEVDHLNTVVASTQRGQEELTEKFSQLEQRQQAYLPPSFVVAFGIMSTLALIFSIVAFSRTF